MPPKKAAVVAAGGTKRKSAEETRGRRTPPGKDKSPEAAAGKPLGRKMPAMKTRADGKATDVNVPQDKPGNTKLDQAWIAEHAGELRVIDDDSDVPFGVRLQWTGKAEDWGSPFQLPPEGERCTGRAYVRDHEGRRIIDADGLVLTRPCTKWRMKGMTVCTHHGGLTDAGLAAASRRLAEASVEAVGQLVYIINKEGTEDRDRISAINSLLDRVGIRGGLQVVVDTPEWQSMLKEMWETDGGGGPGTERDQGATSPRGARGRGVRASNPA